MPDPSTPGDARAVESGGPWVEQVTGVEVLRSTALIGGMSSVVTRHELADGRIVVSRHITDTEWLEREPHLIENEATVLGLLASSPVNAPELIATGPGRLLMSFVPGHMVTAPTELVDRVVRLAAAAQGIHRVELPTQHGLPPWRSWASAQLTPPDWGDSKLWAEAIHAFQGRSMPTTTRPVLLHRDLHPLNVLWHGDRVQIVDWVNGCVGHPHAELGHCRWNLTVLAGSTCADAFLQEYLRQSDHGAYDRYWDLAPAMSFLPGPIGGAGWRAVGRTDLTPPVVIERTEAFLRAALVDSDTDTEHHLLRD